MSLVLWTPRHHVFSFGVGGQGGAGRRGGGADHSFRSPINIDGVGVGQRLVGERATQRHIIFANHGLPSSLVRYAATSAEVVIAQKKAGVAVAKTTRDYAQSPPGLCVAVGLRLRFPSGIDPVAQFAACAAQCTMPQVCAIWGRVGFLDAGTVPGGGNIRAVFPLRVGYLSFFMRRSR